MSSVYERCCVLFNIGALQSQIAKSQNFENDDGLKNAARHFQVNPPPPLLFIPINPLTAELSQGAAGIFQMLQEQVFAHLQKAPTPDLSAESTTALQQLMLAQAQESFCIKACKGERN